MFWAIMAGLIAYHGSGSENLALVVFIFVLVAHHQIEGGEE